MVSITALRCRVRLRLKRLIRRGLPRRRHALACLTTLLISTPGLLAPMAHADLSREYRIKAAYLYNLLRFITWPDADTLADSAVRICVYGYNPFDRYLEKLESRRVDERPIEIRYVGERDPLDDCAMLFISQYNTAQPALLSAEPPLLPILTVSDGDNFLRRGGMVELANVGNNIQLDINLTRGRAAGFQFSANLLEVARTIR